MKKNRRLIAVLLALLFLTQALFIPVYAEDEADEYSNGFTVVVDYYAESLLIVPYEGSDYIEIGTEADSIKYKIISRTVSSNINCLYALKTTSDTLLNSFSAKKKYSALAKDVWYPIYGGEINIEKFIPKKDPANAAKTYHIAVRAANDNFAGDFGYQTRIAIPIKSRYNDKTLKKLLEYDADKQQYKINTSAAFGGDEILFSFDNFGFYSMRKEDSLAVPSSAYFNGGSLKVKTAPILNAAGVQYASSAVVKFSIPKAGASPAVKVDSKKAGLVLLKKDKMEYSKTGFGDADSWTTYTDSATSVLYTEFKLRFGIDFDRDLTIEGANDESVSEINIIPGGEYYYVIYFRTKAVSGKTPASPPKKIKIPYDEVRAALYS